MDSPVILIFVNLIYYLVSISTNIIYFFFDLIFSYSFLFIPFSILFGYGVITLVRKFITGDI